MALAFPPHTREQTRRRNSLVEGIPEQEQAKSDLWAVSEPAYDVVTKTLAILPC
jgi:hypothetical protein